MSWSKYAFMCEKRDWLWTASLNLSCGSFEILPVFVLALFLFLLQNGTEDTALHSASQFGQSLVVAVLLEVRVNNTKKA